MPPFERLQPIIHVEHTSAADILDGLNSLSGQPGFSVPVKPPGEGPDTQLNWALLEIKNAMQTDSAEERKRYSANAVVNARRSLACLVEWYLQRDLATFCKDRPDTAKKQVRYPHRTRRD